MLNQELRGKRRFYRIDHRQPVQFQRKDLPQQFGSLSFDMSEGGIRLNLSQFIPLNSEVTLQIQLSSQKMAECTGRVVWMQKIPFMERYQAGLEFVEDSLYILFKKAVQEFVAKPSG